MKQSELLTDKDKSRLLKLEKTAALSKIPNLIKVGDIKGDLHVHTNINYPTSHDMGASSLAEIFNQAQQFKYSYIGLTDHNPKVSNMTTRSREIALKKRKSTLLKQYEEYKKRVKVEVPKLLIGLEIDIRPDGSLALEDKLVNTLDYAIASIHSDHDLSSEDNTKRIVRVLSHPKVMILGHPTGRMIDRRPGIQINWDEVFAFCAKQNKFLEINSYPTRLDLPQDLIKKALKHKAKFVINTDTHDVDQIENIRYGVWHARCAGLEKKHVLNTLDYSSLRHMINLV